METQEVRKPRGRPAKLAPSAIIDHAPIEAAPAAPALGVADLLQTPEAQAAISAAVSASVEAILGKMEAKRAARPNATSAEEDPGFARTLAREIAGLADQGNKTKRVAPEILRKREEARALMEDLIIDYRTQGVTPEYELTRAVYLDEVLVQPTYIDRNHVQMRTKIGWALVPNEGMRPANPAAEAIFAAFIESVGGATPNLTKPQDSGTLKVLHKSDVTEAPQVGRPRGGHLTLLDRGVPGQVKETAVLGTVAAPARQLA